MATDASGALTSANASVSPLENAGDTIKNAAMPHAATRQNILTSLNVRMRRLSALCRIFVQGRHNSGIATGRLRRQHSGQMIENSVQKTPHQCEQFYRLCFLTACERCADGRKHKSFQYDSLLPFYERNSAADRARHESCGAFGMQFVWPL